MGDMVKVRVWIRTDKIGSKCDEVIEFERDEWEAMSDKERDEDCRQAAFSMGEWGYSVEDD